MSDFKILKKDQYYKILFHAMASPCELLLYCENKQLAIKIVQQAVTETKRFEAKFSRYIINNVCWQLNHSYKEKINIDQETYKLLIYAKQLFELSDGLFDITSGVLRKIWRFEKGAKPPSQAQIKQHLPLINFNKVHFNKCNFNEAHINTNRSEHYEFSLPEKMEIDFGGIGKEYCVDSVVRLISPLCQENQISFLVNFGGDLMAVSYDPSHPPWHVGLESIQDGTQAESVIAISQGAIATSGTTKRQFEYQGKRYAHIINPKTGWPIDNAPRSVSVFASSCSLAGGMSSLAQLQGDKAESFLKDNNVKYICCW